MTYAALLNWTGTLSSQKFYLECLLSHIGPRAHRQQVRLRATVKALISLMNRQASELPGAVVLYRDVSAV